MQDFVWVEDVGGSRSFFRVKKEGFGSFSDASDISLKMLCIFKPFAEAYRIGSLHCLDGCCFFSFSAWLHNLYYKVTDLTT